VELATGVYFMAVALLRDVAGGSGAGVGLLVLLPVIASALHGTRAQLGAVLAGVALTFVAPIVAIGGAVYPLSGLRVAAFMIVFSAMFGVTIQRLVGELRAREAEREALLKRLDHLAHTDALTGLPNRRAWNDALHRALHGASRSGGSVSVAILDLDDFKAINDEHGHLAGDRLLRELAASWPLHVRAVDVLARLGGDEFGVLLVGCPVDEAEATVNRLRGDAPPGHALSAGLAEWDGIETADQLVERADAALYAAKAAGRDRITIASP
jgi:diguanylate cyclase (GGDEF)-like protein